MSTLSIWEIASGEGDIADLKTIIQTISVDMQDDAGFSPLHAASSYGNVEAIQLLFDHGATLNIQDGDGDTPLHFAECAESTKLLLSLGANPLVRNNNDMLPIEQAYTEGRESVVECLSPFTPEYRRVEQEEEELDLEDAEHAAVDVYELAKQYGINLTIVKDDGDAVDR